MRVLLLLLAAAGTTLGVPLNVGIYGGDLASPGQFPFIVAIRDIDQFCGGSIISNNWIVTAAHCIELQTKNFTILAGTNQLHSGGTEYNISSWIIHPEWDMSNAHNDIALVQIDGEFEFNDLIQPVEYIEVGANSTCFAAGWGVTENEESPEDLRFVDLTTISLEKCAEIGKGFIDGMYLGEEQVCAGGPVGKGVCNKDSGGPLICDGKLAGITSYGIHNCGEGYPDVYTRPTAYVDWINESIGGSTLS